MPCNNGSIRLAPLRSVCHPVDSIVRSGCQDVRAKCGGRPWMDRWNAVPGVAIPVRLVVPAPPVGPVVASRVVNIFPGTMCHSRGGAHNDFISAQRHWGWALLQSLVNVWGSIDKLAGPIIAPRANFWARQRGFSATLGSELSPSTQNPANHRRRNLLFHTQTTNHGQAGPDR